MELLSILEMIDMFDDILFCRSSMRSDIRGYYLPGLLSDRVAPILKG